MRKTERITEIALEQKDSLNTGVLLQEGNHSTRKEVVPKKKKRRSGSRKAKKKKDTDTHDEAPNRRPDVLLIRISTSTSRTNLCIAISKRWLKKAYSKCRG